MTSLAQVVGAYHLTPPPAGPPVTGFDAAEIEQLLPHPDPSTWPARTGELPGHPQVVVTTSYGVFRPDADCADTHVAGFPGSTPPRSSC